MTENEEKIFEVLMIYWELLPKKMKQTIDVIYNHFEPTTADDYNEDYLKALDDFKSLNTAKQFTTVPEKDSKAPSETVSLKKLPVAHDKIKRAIERLRVTFGFGIPDFSSNDKSIEKLIVKYNLIGELNERKA
tara:strand:+ start:98 stop:496 length:399 start_codon:yes stop_codon:yes gene_type:complete